MLPPLRCTAALDRCGESRLVLSAQFVELAVWQAQTEWLESLEALNLVKELERRNAAIGVGARDLGERMRMQAL